MSESEITLNSEALKKEKQNLFKEIINLKELSMKNTEIINELNKKLYDYEEQIKELKNDLEVSIHYQSVIIFLMKSFEIIREYCSFKKVIQLRN